MSAFRKKPVVIEAVLWDGTKLAMDEIHAMGGWEHVAPNPPADDLIIDTLEGEMRARIGDYVIRGVQGEFYPCKPDIFEETYEAVEPDGGGAK